MSPADGRRGGQGWRPVTGLRWWLAAGGFALGVVAEALAYLRGVPRAGLRAAPDASGAGRPTTLASRPGGPGGLRPTARRPRGGVRPRPRRPRPGGSPPR